MIGVFVMLGGFSVFLFCFWVIFVFSALVCSRLFYLFIYLFIYFYFFVCFGCRIILVVMCVMLFKDPFRPLQQSF